LNQIIINDNLILKVFNNVNFKSINGITVFLDGEEKYKNFNTRNLFNYENLFRILNSSLNSFSDTISI
jgi:hypothetical protein